MNTIHAQSLLGRHVRDDQGKNLGRVYDLEAEGDGSSLRVIALRVGVRVWISRFGWKETSRGRSIPWSAVTQLSPDIVVMRSVLERT